MVFVNKEKDYLLTYLLSYINHTLSMLMQHVSKLKVYIWITVFSHVSQAFDDRYSFCLLSK